MGGSSFTLSPGTYAVTARCLGSGATHSVASPYGVVREGSCASAAAGVVGEGQLMLMILHSNDVGEEIPATDCKGTQVSATEFSIMCCSVPIVLESEVPVTERNIMCCSAHMAQETDVPA